MSLRSRNGRLLVAGGAILILALVVALIAGLGGDDSDDSAQVERSAAADAALDADAKAGVRTAQTALEVYAVDRGGSYASATVAGLVVIEPTLPENLEVLFVSGDSYSLRVVSESGVAYSVVRSPTGVINRRCDPPGEAGCPESGDW